MPAATPDCPLILKRFDDEGVLRKVRRRVAHGVARRIEVECAAIRMHGQRVAVALEAEVIGAAEDVDAALGQDFLVALGGGVDGLECSEGGSGALLVDPKSLDGLVGVEQLER